jgi:hypothetical protein
VGGEVFETKADADGFVNLQVASTPEKCLVEWGHADDDTQTYLFSRTIYLQMLDLEEDEEVKRRLHNLGYPYDGDLKENVKAFQTDYRFSPGGKPSSVKPTLRQWFDDPTQIQKRPEPDAKNA